MKKTNPAKNGRRIFLKNSLAAAAAIGLPQMSLAQAMPEITTLSPTMRMVAGLGGNILMFDTGTGYLLVDTGRAEDTPVLLDILGGETVTKVFNTHWHLDQVGGNETFGLQDAQIIAHRKTQLHLSIPYYLYHEDRYQPALPVRARPNAPFYTDGKLPVGGEEIDCGYLELAHTDGDIFVRFPNANVIAVGDVVSPERDPEFDWFGGGWVGGRVDALNLILDMCNDETRIIPSYGPVIGRAHVEAERDFMQFMYDTLVDQVRMGFDAQDSLDSGIMDSLPRKLNDPYKFLYDAHKGLWANHNKLEPNIV